MEKKKKVKVVTVFVGLAMMVGMILCIVLYLLNQNKQNNEVTLNDIKQLNGGVMPDYEQKENGTLLWLNGCFSQRKITSAKEAVLALNDIRELLGLKDAQSELQETFVEEDDLGISCQFEQIYEGICVYGSMVSLWADYEGNAGFLRADCSVIPEDFVCEPKISMEEAQKRAIEESGLENVSIEEIPEEIANETRNDELKDMSKYKEYLCIYDTGNTVRLAWRVYLIAKMEDYEAVIDAENGDLLYLCKKSCNVKEEKLQVMAIGLQGKTHTINITKNTTGIYELQDKTRKIILYNGGGGTSKFTMITSKSKTVWDSAGVTTMSHLRDIYDYYRNLTGRYSYDGAYFLATASTVKAAINTGIVDNAYWSGNKSMILIGTGSSSGVFYPMSLAVAKDIIAHEFTHAVISDRTSLENVYYGPAGAINEAYADIFGCLIEGDWKIGEDITKKKSLRDLVIPFNTSNPSKVGGAFYQDYKTDTSDYGGIHKNSTIISHIAYVLYQNGMSQNNLAKLWYRSLCLGYGRDTDFYDVRVNVLAAAKALGFSTNQIKIINQAFDDANITQATCQESSSSYKSLYEKLYITNQSIDSMDQKKEIPVAEYSLQWEDENLDLDLYIEGVTKDGEKFVISYENQEYRNKAGELIANLVCDFIKGAATETIQVWSEEIEITKCTVHVYGERKVENKENSVTVTVYKKGSERDCFTMPREAWKEWNVF